LLYARLCQPVIPCISIYTWLTIAPLPTWQYEDIANDANRQGGRGEMAETHAQVFFTLPRKSQ
jgi:hypothetical protein